MKNLILPIALAVILLTGCSKEASIDQFEEQNIDSVYVLNQLDGTTTWETMALNELPKSTCTGSQNNSIWRVKTNGYYMPSTRDAMTITWSGTQDESGYYGRAELKQISANHSLHFLLETECITVYGNEAVYGGVITQTIIHSGNVPNISLGWRFYFKVIDSEGGYVDYDQIANTTIFVSPMSPSLCGVYLPNNPIWSSQGYSDVIEPGFVEVSN